MTNKPNISVYDNYGKTLDRYTVIIDKDVYTMCHNPRSPMGVNQYLCDTSKFLTPKSGLLSRKDLLSKGELCEAINDRCGNKVPW